MSDIQTAMSMLITVFHKYSGKEGDPKTLSKNELKTLLQAEMGDMLGKTKDQSSVDRIFKEMDRDKNNTVDFKEYMQWVCSFTMVSNEFFTRKK